MLKLVINSIGENESVLIKGVDFLLVLALARKRSALTIDLLNKAETRTDLV